MEIRTPFLPLIFLLFAQIISYGQNPIDLINPQVGQQNQYLFFEGTDYCDLDEFENITYTQDTLILTVDELMPNGDFIVSEKLSAGSNSSVLGIDGQSEILYTFNTQNETLTISTSEAVSLFFLYASEIQPVLSLTEVLTNQTFIQGWKTGLSCSFTEYAHGIDQNILGKLYSHLNIFNDDQDFDSDGFGVTFIYNYEDGIIGYFFVSHWTMNGFGWHQLPNDSGCSTPNIDLGSEVVLGANEMHTFFADEIYDAYTWQDGSTDASFTFDATTVSPGTYEVSVIVNDLSNCSWTDSVNVVVLDPNTIDDLSDVQSIEIYPTLLNSNSILHFKTDDFFAEHLDVLIYDQFGKLVYQTDLNNTQQYIDNLNLDSGIYFVEITNDGYSYKTQKILIQN